MNPQTPIPGGPRYKNPFVRMDAKRNFFIAHVNIILLTVLGALVLAFFIGLVIIRNKQYNITTALFSGNKRIMDEQLLIELNSVLHGNQWFGMLPKKNIYFVNKNVVESRFKQAFGFRDVTIDTIAKTKTIHIRVSETPITYKVTVGETSSFASSDGLILEKVPENNATVLFTITLTQAPTLITNERQQCDQNLIRDIEEIIRLDQGIQSFDFLGASLEQDISSDTTLSTNNGWSILIDRSKAIERQLLVAQTIFNEKIKGTEKENSLEYIDVRIEDRAFFK